MNKKSKLFLFLIAVSPAVLNSSDAKADTLVCRGGGPRSAEFYVQAYGNASFEAVGVSPNTSGISFSATWSDTGSRDTLLPGQCAFAGRTASVNDPQTILHIIPEVPTKMTIRSGVRAFYAETRGIPAYFPTSTVPESKVGTLLDSSSYWAFKVHVAAKGPDGPNQGKGFFVVDAYTSVTQRSP